MIINESIVAISILLISHSRISRNEDDQNSDVYFFSTHFYTKLTEERTRGDMNAGNELVAKWTNKPRKHIDIFSKKFICIPVNHGNQHWGLFVLVNVGKILISHKYHNSRGKEIDSKEPAPFMLYFDSMGAAGSLNYYHKRICSWLDFEVKKRKLFPEVTCPFENKNKNVLFPIYAPKGKEVFRFKRTTIVCVYIFNLILELFSPNSSTARKWF